tara:strand:- start:3095 stop:3355 length:261 start_codon:yes stop_codon:yes gene_type:complete
MNLIYQIFLIGTIIISSFTPSELISEEKASEDFVYICNKPGQKCYYLLPCNDLRVSCNKAKGKLFKVPLSRAIQMKRSKCDCKENN